MTTVLYTRSTVPPRTIITDAQPSKLLMYTEDAAEQMVSLCSDSHEAAKIKLLGPCFCVMLTSGALLFYLVLVYFASETRFPSALRPYN